MAIAMRVLCVCCASVVLFEGFRIQRFGFRMSDLAGRNGAPVQRCSTCRTHLFGQLKQALISALRSQTVFENGTPTPNAKRQTLKKAKSHAKSTPVCLSCIQNLHT